jgi:hypothetical protein
MYRSLLHLKLMICVCILHWTLNVSSWKTGLFVEVIHNAHLYMQTKLDDVAAVGLPALLKQFLRVSQDQRWDVSLLRVIYHCFSAAIFTYLPAGRCSDSLTTTSVLVSFQGNKTNSVALFREWTIGRNKYLQTVAWPPKNHHMRFEIIQK